MLARACGQTDAAPILQQSLGEEQAMAQWLDDHLKPTIHRFLELDAEGKKAAH